jgi:hypothetical protein
LLSVELYTLRYGRALYSPLAQYSPPTYKSRVCLMEPLYTPLAKGISTMQITLSIATHPTIAGFVALIFSDDLKKGGPD